MRKAFLVFLSCLSRDLLFEALHLFSWSVIIRGQNLVAGCAWFSWVSLHLGLPRGQVGNDMTE